MKDTLRRGRSLEYRVGPSFPLTFPLTNCVKTRGLGGVGRECILEWPFEGLFLLNGKETISECPHIWKGSLLFV